MMNAPVAWALAVLSIFGIVLGACGGSSRYPTAYKVLPCGNAMSVDHQAHAYAAMLLSLQERQWTFHHQNKKKHSVLARNCIASSSLDCVTLSFIANPNGMVSVLQVPNQPIQRNMLDDVFRWMKYFRQSYSNFSCFTDDALREQVRNYGFTF